MMHGMIFPAELENRHMKTPNVKTPQPNNKSNSYHTRPDIRDDLDSRANEEQNFKGDDITHNKKAHHNLKPGKKS